MHECLRLLGFASFAIAAVPHSRLYMRELQRVVIPLQVLQAALDTPIVTNPGLQNNLQFWAQLTLEQATKPIALPPPAYQMYTDACKEGWGAVYSTTSLSFDWTPQEALMTINELRSEEHTSELQS